MIKTAVVFWYNANQDYVAKQLCGNRDKPELNCNGRCVLAKKIAAAEQRENSVPNPSQIQVKIEPCVLSTQIMEIDEMLEVMPVSRFPELNYLPTSSLAKGVFHPPKYA